MTDLEIDKALEACPFCGNEPSFSGDASEWKDDYRYVELSLGCCVSMTEQIGWRRAREMTHEAKTAELRSRLQLRWNTRAALEQQQAEPCQYCGLSECDPKCMWIEQAPQQQAEPVAVHQWRKQGCSDWYDGHSDFGDAGWPYETRTLYTTPPQRKPLTDEQVHAIWDHKYRGWFSRSQIEDITRAIEAAHGIKGEA